jgi:hypothetical protein
MSWLPHDAATWGLWLAIAALVLMYPMNVVANLSSPWLHARWVARSQASLIKRRDELLRQRAEAQNRPEIDLGAELILITLHARSIDVVFGTNYVISSIWFVLYWLKLIGHEFHWTTINVFFLGIMAMNLIMGFINRHFVESLYSPYSPTNRLIMDRELDAIEAKLVT